MNLFVAGFAGSPAMNFVLADLVRDDGPAVAFAGYRLPVPASVFDGKPGLPFDRRAFYRQAATLGPCGSQPGT